MGLSGYHGARRLRELDDVAEAGEVRGRRGDAVDEDVEGEDVTRHHVANADIDGPQAGGGVAQALAVRVGAVDAVAAAVVEAVVAGLADAVLMALGVGCRAGVGRVHVKTHHHPSSARAVYRLRFVVAAAAPDNKKRQPGGYQR